MSPVTRRGALTLIGSLGAGATASVGLSAAMPPLTEDPNNRVGRLFAELSEALAEGFGGNFAATVFPAGHAERGALLEIATWQESQRQREVALRMVETLRDASPEDRANYHVGMLRRAVNERFERVHKWTWAPRGGGGVLCPMA